MYWVFKCNTKSKFRAVGDWADFFNEGRTQRWGSTEWANGIWRANPGDTVIAYQTDRNELVGLAEVIKWKVRDKYKDLILKPLNTIGVKIKPLKQAHPKISKIDAFRPGPILTLYKISDSEARLLLRAAGAALKPISNSIQDKVAVPQGAGFGTPQQNKRVENAAMQFVIRHYCRQGWKVKDISKQNLGFDLICNKGNNCHNVEVKGAAGSEHKFIITVKEKKNWERNKSFVLALVTNSLKKPLLTCYSGPQTLIRFAWTPISYIAALQK